MSCARTSLLLPGITCFMNHVMEGKIEWSVEVTGRREGRRRELLDDLKETRGYCKFKDEALDRTLCWTRNGRGYWPVVRQNAVWKMNILLTACCERGNKRLVSCKDNFLTSWSSVNFSNRFSLQGFCHLSTIYVWNRSSSFTSRSPQIKTHILVYIILWVCG